MPWEPGVGGEASEGAGVVVRRRSFLAVAAAALLGPREGVAAALEQDAGDGVSLEAFLKDVVPVARRLVRDRSAHGQDRYLRTIAAHAVGLADVAVPKMRPSGQGEGAFIGVNPGGDPFVALHWRMEPGAVIRSHAHTYGNVVTIGLAGEALVSNHEMLGGRDFDAEGTFRVRRTVHQVLRPGDVNLVSLERDYIHGFRAGPDGARGLDLTTRIRQKRPTPYLDRSSRPLDDTGTVFEATWTT